MIALLALAAPAVADHGILHDRTGDVGRHAADRDITRSTWRHGSGGRLVHTVSVRGRIGNPRTGVGKLPRLQIRVRGHRNSAVKRGDGVAIKRVSRHKLKYVLSEATLGDPRGYKWRFVFPSRSCGGCVYDRIPNHGMKRHRLQRAASLTPIRHVVVIYQENHSFDNVFGRLCARTRSCDGATEGTLPDGSTIPLRKSPDVVPPVGHTTQNQNAAIDGGRMDGFAYVNGCDAAHDYPCFTLFGRRQIPNLWRLAKSFAMSDRTFQLDSVPSWGAHLELVSATLDGFVGDPPNPDEQHRLGPGWGCDSGLDAPWQAPSGEISQQPSCVPYYGLDPKRFPHGGAYRATRVQPTPTIMDRLDHAGLSWKFYTADPGEGGYLWAICPTYAKCLYTHRHKNQVDRWDVNRDAKAGTLPNFSIVIPSVHVSQHNEQSMRAGDNWIGRVIENIGNGPDWRSTAIFITYDDCGCFYDHVPPPPGLGIRAPMVMVSPWTRPGFVDSNDASMASLLAFTEHNFGLQPLNDRDGLAYDYSGAFDFNQTPLPPVPMTQSKLSPRARWVTDHPVKPTGT